MGQRGRPPKINEHSNDLFVVLSKELKKKHIKRLEESGVALVKADRQTRVKAMSVFEYAEQMDEHFSVEQMRAAAYFAMPKMYRPTNAQIAEELGVATITVEKWASKPHIRKLVLKLTKVYFMDDIPNIIQGIKENAMKGGMAAAKLFLEYVAEWESNRGNTVQINQQINVGEQDVEEKLKHLREKT